MNHRRLPEVAGAAFVLSSLGLAAELHVQPGESIQAAIDAAVNQDHVVVHPGTYHESIFFKGKAIVVRSLAGPDVTTIDATGLNKRVVNFIDLETPASVLDGFTVSGGSGGILCQFSQPTIRQCLVRENSVTGRGGGLFASGGSVTIGPIVEDCVFEENVATDAGGGIAISNKGITLRRCVVADNFSSQTGGGGGISLQGSGTATIEDCVIADNISASVPGSGLRIVPSSNAKVTIRRTEIIRNRGTSVGGVHVSSTTLVGTGCAIDFDSVLIAENDAIGMAHSIAATETKKFLRVTNATIARNGLGGFDGSGAAPSVATLRNCIVYGNGGLEVAGSPTISFSNVAGGSAGSGNFDADPGFAAPEIGDYHLRFDSVCRNAGSEPSPGSFDLEGDPRVQDGAIDLGADEFHRRLYVGLTTSPLATQVRINVLDVPNQPVLMIAGLSQLAVPFVSPYGTIYVGPSYFPVFLLGVTPGDGWLMQQFEVRPDFGLVKVHLQAVSGPAATNAVMVELP